jgi:hypothetical protein
MDPFVWMVRTSKPKVEKTISRAEYDEFCRDFLFNLLKGEKFGTAFSKRFGIEDGILDLGLSTEATKDHIKSMGYVKDL